MVSSQQAALSIETLDDAVVLSISGEVDIANKEQLELALQNGLAQTSGTFIANLLDLTYADSCCINALLHVQRTAQRMNKQLIVVIQEGGELHKIFHIAGLVKVFDIRHSLEGALAAKPDDQERSVRL